MNIGNINGENDRKNLAAIAHAIESGRINDEAGQYLKKLYSDGMAGFNEIFHVLGKCFGAPKAAVMQYDYTADIGIANQIKISDINPLSAYIVYHRLNSDPVRNQFFSVKDGHNIDLNVSSIISVIIGAQKSIERSLDKITGKYYTDYTEDVANATERVLSLNNREASGIAVAQKIREQFSKKFITTAPETVLSIIGNGYEKIAVDLVRELDKITKPHLRLNDVWRVKCLFDLVPQVRDFIERIIELEPDRIISSKDKFCDIKSPRNYRDAKIIFNLGTADNIIPVEIICQVRTLFDFDRKNHSEYENTRKNKAGNKEDIEKRMSQVMENGIHEYNLIIYRCLGDLLERVGWNILYNRDIGSSLFDGFPIFSKQYYPPKVVDAIMVKLEGAVENEVFKITDAPRPLGQVEELEIFRWMARFILVSAMPYMNGHSEMPNDTTAGRLFNFVMKELHRYGKR